MISAAGKRTKRITVESHNGNRVEGAPTYGVEADWNQLLTNAPARYQQVSGGEQTNGLQIEAEANGLLMILSTPRSRAIKAKMRVRMGSRVMNIVNVLDMEGDERELAIQVTEAV